MSRSSLPERRPESQVRRARNLRRVGLAVLAVVVLAGATGLLGVRTGQASASGAGYDLTVAYPAVSRPGLATRFEVRIRRVGGFPPDEPVRVRMRSAYFDLFDTNDLTPQPDTETADDASVVGEFAPPPGEVLTLSVDTRISPARQLGERGEVQVLDDRGEPVVSVQFRTWLWP